jgi:hypothetical protein
MVSSLTDRSPTTDLRRQRVVGRPGVVAGCVGPVASSVEVVATNAVVGGSTGLAELFGCWAAFTLL